MHVGTASVWGTHHPRGILLADSEWEKSHYRGAWLDVCRNRLRVGHPIQGGRYWQPLSGGNPIIEAHDWKVALQNVKH